MQAQQTVRIGNTLLQGTGKQGILRPDSQGYYKICVGAYGAYNNVGFLYDERSGCDLFKPGSILMRKVEKGVLKAEFKHPPREKWMSDQDYINRIRQIDIDRACAEIAHYELDHNGKDEQGRRVTKVIATVKPWGPFGEHLEKSLNSPTDNTYFSVRSLTVDDNMRGIKYSKEIVTHDFVDEGGIYIASKYHSPGLENFTDERPVVTQAILYNLKEEQDKRRGLGLEDHSTDVGILINSLGWAKGAAPHVPRWMGW